MSLQALSWAFAQQSLKSPQKFVLVTLANYADENGSCFPGQARISLDTGMSVRSVKRCLKSLEELGYIWVENRQRANGSRTSNRYLLKLIQSAMLSPPKVPTCHPPGDTLSPPEPSLNRKLIKERKKEIKKKENPPPNGFDDFYFHYPLKVAKKAARQKYDVAIKSGVDPTTILEACKRYAKEQKKHGAPFTAHPSTWLNQGRYEDATDKTNAEPVYSFDSSTYNAHVVPK